MSDRWVLGKPHQNLAFPYFQHIFGESKTTSPLKWPDQCSKIEYKQINVLLTGTGYQIFKLELLNLNSVEPKPNFNRIFG